AEDGIRDFHVTGVQTCALPICSRSACGGACSIAGQWQFLLAVYRQVRALGQVLADQSIDVLVAAALPGAVRVAKVDRHPRPLRRSEERRVGKEWRCAWRGEE